MTTMAAFSDSFLRVVASSLDAAVLALLVGGVLLLVGNRLAPAWRHALWLLVALRLLLPVAPESPLSWRHWALSSAFSETLAFPSLSTDVERGGPVGESLEAPHPVLPEKAPPAVLPAAPQPSAATREEGAGRRVFDLRGRDPLHLAALLWGVGVAGFLLTVALASRRFRRQVARGERRESPAQERALRQLVEAGAELGLRRLPRLVVTDAVGAPALARPWRPEILLPLAMLESLDDRRLRHVLLHELAHWRRGDLWVNWVLCVLQALHWLRIRSPSTRW